MAVPSSLRLGEVAHDVERYLAAAYDGPRPAMSDVLRDLIAEGVKVKVARLTKDQQRRFKAPLNARSATSATGTRGR